MLHQYTFAILGLMAFAASGFKMPTRRRAVGAFDLPDITLEEAQADPSQLTGVLTIAYWVDEDCSGPAVVTRTVPAKGFELHSLDPLSDDPLDNLYCMAAPEADDCDLVDTFYAYKQEDGYQLFVEDSNREYPFLAYGQCAPTQVYGDGVYYAFFEGGEIVAEEIVEPDHHFYPIPSASYEESKEDTSLLSGLVSVSIYATPDCSGQVQATIPLPSTGGKHRIAVKEPASEDVMDDILCIIETIPTEECVASPGTPIRHYDEESVNIFFEGENTREVIQPYFECVSQPNFRGSYILTPGGHGSN